ncbi:ferredoxin [Nocardia sp. NPDC051750]|uniref:ferredoxin n=1 Tax=Nocardia sp. NPDC051750 TaxID=3364325 RepID=UPI0037B8BAFE
MRVEVESSRCQGHTPCAMIAPESFALDAVDGHARAMPGAVAPEHERQVREAVRSRPEQAVRIRTE